MIWYLYETDQSYTIVPSNISCNGAIVAAGSRDACEAAYRLFDLAGWDIYGCIIRPEVVLADLAEVEAKLAERYGLTGNIHQQLVQKAMDDDLVEDGLVADWHDLVTLSKNLD